MNYASSIAGRAILSVDHFINQAMTYAWTSTLQRRCPGQELRGSLRGSPMRLQPADEDDYGGGDFCSLEAAPPTDDDQPLE
jgi:hypothetical protein